MGRPVCKSNQPLWHGPMEASLFHGWNDGTQEVGALLIVGDELLLTQAYEQSRSASLRVSERFGAADGELVELGYLRAGCSRRFASQPALQHEPDVPDGECAARQYDELHEIAPGHVIVSRPIYWEITPPFGLFGVGPPVRRGRILGQLALLLSRDHAEPPSRTDANTSAIMS